VTADDGQAPAGGVMACAILHCRYVCGTDTLAAVEVVSIAAAGLGRYQNGCRCPDRAQADPRHSKCAGIPVWWHLTSIHRPALPFDDMLAAGAVHHLFTGQSPLAVAMLHHQCCRHVACSPMSELMWGVAQMLAGQQDRHSPTRWRSAAAGLCCPSACAMQTPPGDCPDWAVAACCHHAPCW
jgi:Phosphatidylinositol-glycan biosynthesis class S protein